MTQKLGRPAKLGHLRAEEKAALAMINFEEKKVKEQQVMQSMQALVKQHLQREEGGGE